MRWCSLVFVAAASLWLPTTARAQAEPEPASAVTLEASPFAREMRHHTYQTLRKNPWKAFGWELLLPGAGNIYTGIRVNAIVTIVVSVTGAGLWVAGAVADEKPLYWVGVGTFTAGRAYGLVTAPWGAALLNAAFRRQIGLAGSF